MPRKASPKKPNFTHTETKTHSKPIFGSPEWVMAALQRRFEDAPEKPGAALASLTEYLKLRKLERAFWPPKIVPTQFIWVDPDDYEQPAPLPVPAGNQ